MKKFNINIHQDSFWYLIIYSGIIFIFVLLGSIPFYHYNSNLLEENKKIKNQIEEQKELRPIYANMLMIMKNEDLRVLPDPEKTSIHRGETGKFQDTLRMIAGQAGLTVVSIKPDLSTLAGSSTFLLHDVTLKGEFGNFRKMLIELGSVSYLDRIEEISILQYPDSLALKMKIWIAIK